jgi:hypothetical protein
VSSSRCLTPRGDEHERLLAGKRANRSINTYFQPAAPRPPPLVPDPRQLCWGLNSHGNALPATMPERPGATRTVGEAREAISRRDVQAVWAAPPQAVQQATRDRAAAGRRLLRDATRHAGGSLSAGVTYMSRWRESDSCLPTCVGGGWNPIIWRVRTRKVLCGAVPFSFIATTDYLTVRAAVAHLTTHCVTPDQPPSWSGRHS